jgi:hypothetical protein
MNDNVTKGLRYCAKLLIKKEKLGTSTGYRWYGQCSAQKNSSNSYLKLLDN